MIKQFGNIRARVSIKATGAITVYRHSSNAFIEGIAASADIYGSTYPEIKISRGVTAKDVQAGPNFVDAFALRSDWMTVGNHLKSSMVKVGSEFLTNGVMNEKKTA